MSVPFPSGSFLQATADGEAALVAAAREWLGDCATVADLLLPDILTYRLGTQASFSFAVRNGRTLTDDAVAVIVSEETGYISLALDGQIERNLTPDALRDRLRTLVTLRRGSVRQAGARAYDV